MIPVWAHPDTHPGAYSAISDFVSHRIWGDGRGLPDGTALGILHGGALVAGVIYHNWQPREAVVEISVASDNKRWLTRPVLAEMFGFAFGQLGCQAVVCRMDPDNWPLRRICGAYGFTEHTLPRLRGRDRAEIVCILGDDDWRGNKFNAR